MKSTVLQIREIRGGMDAGENLRLLLRRRAALFDLAVDDAARMIAARIRLLDRGVDKHDIDAGNSRHIGDAAAHHARAQNAQRLHIGRRFVLRPARALAEILHGEEQRADHVAAGGIHQQLHEIARFDAQARIDRHLDAFIDAGHDVALRGIIAVALLAQHRVAHGEDLAAAGRERSAAGKFEIFLVPGLHGFRLALDPRLRRIERDRPRGTTACTSLSAERLLRIDAGALQDERQRLHGADQTRQALRAAAAGQQSHFRFRQTELQLRIVGDDAIMAGERHFETAAQRQAVDRGRDRLAAGLELPQRLMELHDAGIARGNRVLRRSPSRRRRCSHCLPSRPAPRPRRSRSICRW